jgi:hypothetical protein
VYLITNNFLCDRKSYQKYRYTLRISNRDHASLLFDSVRFLQPEVASIWFLEHIFREFKDHHDHLDRICLGKALRHPGSNRTYGTSTVTGCGHHANTAIQRPNGLGERPFLHSTCSLLTFSTRRHRSVFLPGGHA